MMLTMFQPVQRHVGEAGLLAELGIRKFTPRFAQVFRQLDIQAFSHPKTVTNLPYRMCYDFV